LLVVDFLQRHDWRALSRILPVLLESPASSHSVADSEFPSPSTDAHDRRHQLLQLTLLVTHLSTAQYAAALSLLHAAPSLSTASWPSAAAWSASESLLLSLLPTRLADLAALTAFLLAHQTGQPLDPAGPAHSFAANFDFFEQRLRSSLPAALPAPASSTGTAPATPPLCVIDLGLLSSLTAFPASAGLGVATTAALHKGALLCQEPALLAFQKPANAAVYQACAQCLRFLGIAPAASAPAPAPPRSRGAPPQVKSCRCPCGERYCSEQCRQTAATAHHQLICPAQLATPAARAARAAFQQLAERTTWRLLIVLQMVAMIMRAPARNPFASFEAPSWRRIAIYDPVERVTEAETFQQLHPGLDFAEYKSVILEEALSLLPAIFAPHRLDWLTLPFLDALLGLIDINFTDLDIPVPLPARSAAPAAERLIRGTGLFEIHSKINHSCTPNCRALTSGGAAVLAIEALRPLAPTEQLFLSYCDTQLRYAERQRLLKSSYLFDCLCARCQAEDPRHQDSAAR
jgi:hypothetical protein